MERMEDQPRGGAAGRSRIGADNADSVGAYSGSLRATSPFLNGVATPM
jgi:hypothetical protein